MSGKYFGLVYFHWFKIDNLIGSQPWKWHLEWRQVDLQKIWNEREKRGSRKEGNKDLKEFVLPASCSDFELNE